MATTLVAAVLLSLTVLPDVAVAVLTTSTSQSPPAVTESHGPIVASYSHKPATTSLSGYAGATSTYSVSPSATAISNGTLPACKPVQYSFPAGTGGNATRAAAVKEAYLYAWKAYEEYAFGYDELQPLTKSSTNDWCRIIQDPPLYRALEASSLNHSKLTSCRWLGRYDCRRP